MHTNAMELRSPTRLQHSLTSPLLVGALKARVFKKLSRLFKGIQTHLRGNRGESPPGPLN